MPATGCGETTHPAERPESHRSSTDKSKVPTSSTTHKTTSQRPRDDRLTRPPDKHRRGTAPSDTRGSRPPHQSSKTPAKQITGAGASGSSDTRGFRPPLQSSRTPAKQITGAGASDRTRREESSRTPLRDAENKEESRRHTDPSTKLYRDRRAAYRVVQRWGDRPASELDERRRESLAWARAVIAQKEEALKASRAGEGKRPRPREDAESSPKRARQGPSPRQKPMRSFSEVVKDNMIWAVIDRGNPDGAISPGNWKLTEIALLKIYKEIMKESPGPAPKCRDAGWHHGQIKLVACLDKRSADLYSAAISRVGEVWPGARLEVVSRDMIPSRPRSRTWVPAEPSDPKEILELLQMSNPSLPTEDWKVVKVGEVKGSSREIVVVLNEESVPTIEKADGEVSYGFGSICQRIYKQDSKEAARSKEKKMEERRAAEEGATGIEDIDSDSLSSLEGDSDVRVASRWFSKLTTIEDEDLDLLDTGVQAESEAREESSHGAVREADEGGAD